VHPNIQCYWGGVTEAGNCQWRRKPLIAPRTPVAVAATMNEDAVALIHVAGVKPIWWRVQVHPVTHHESDPGLMS